MHTHLYTVPIVALTALTATLLSLLLHRTFKVGDLDMLYFSDNASLPEAPISYFTDASATKQTCCNHSTLKTLGPFRLVDRFFL